MFAKYDDMVDCSSEIGGYVEMFPFAKKCQFDAKEQKEIRSLTDVRQVAIFKHGFVALQNDRHLKYVGKNNTLKQYFSQMSNIKQIKRNDSGEGLFCLKENGDVIEVTPNGISSPILKNVRRMLMIDEDFELRFVSDSGQLKMKSYTLNGILDAQTFYANFGSDDIEYGAIGICKDGTLWCYGVENAPKEMLELKGVVYCHIEDFGTDMEIKVKLYNDEEKEFKVKTDTFSIEDLYGFMI